MSKSDPIRKSHYDAVEQADTFSDRLFYIAAALSLVFPFVEKGNHPIVFDWVQYMFALAVVGLFFIGLASRLYLVPRAEDMRRKDFFSSAMDINLTHQRTDGYYNNELIEPWHRMAAQLLENSHFTKGITLKMLLAERAKISVYIAIWLACVIYRRTDIGWIVAATQAVFSEQLISKWWRMEWLRMRSEETFQEVYKLFQTGTGQLTFTAMAIEAVTSYEAAKANAGIVLSSRLFNKLNPELSVDWDNIKAALKI